MAVRRGRGLYGDQAGCGDGSGESQGGGASRSPNKESGDDGATGSSDQCVCRAGSGGGTRSIHDRVSAGKMAQFNAVIDDGRSLARQVIGLNNNPAEVTMAKNYDKYLRTLKDSMRGIKSDRDAERLIAQARQTRAYLVYLKH